MYFANADISGPVGLGDEAGWDDVIEINLQAHVRAARTLVPDAGWIEARATSCRRPRLLGC